MAAQRPTLSSDATARINLQAKGLLLKDLLDSHLMRDQAHAQKLHPLVLFLRDVAPDLPALFEAFEAEIGLLESNSFNKLLSKPGEPPAHRKWKAFYDRGKSACLSWPILRGCLQVA